eukprot:418521_1
MENINSIIPVLEFGAPFIVEKHNAKFENVKKEIKCNTFHPLKSKEWNQLLKSCLLLSRSQKARISGLKLKEIVAMKLYTDFDGLRCEYKKCFIQSLNDNNRWNK